MFTRLFSYLRWRRSAKGEQFADLNVELLATANANLALQLERANKKIKHLKARLAESDLLLAHAQARMGDSKYVALPLDDDLSEPGLVASSKKARRHKWIGDIWVCTGQEYLKDAERAWKHGDIDSARSAVETSLSASPFVSTTEALYSRLFFAAILYATGKYNESISQLNFVMGFVSSRSEIQRFQHRDIVSAAYFIEAMAFMALEKFERAHWSFSRSLRLPGYCDKAREYQLKAIEGFARQQAYDDGASGTLSLRPVISLDGHLPVPADVDDDPYHY